MSDAKMIERARAAAATDPRIDDASRITQEGLIDLLVERFGDDHETWAFVCPNCGHVARAEDFRPHVRAGQPASAYLGTFCVGRLAGALDREPSNTIGCDWTASGLFRGPLMVEVADGSMVGAFFPAPADWRDEAVS